MNERVLVSPRTPRGTSTGDPARPARPLADSESALMSDRRLSVRALSVLFVVAVAGGAPGGLAAQESSCEERGWGGRPVARRPRPRDRFVLRGRAATRLVFTGGVAMSVLLAVYESQHVSTYNGQRVGSCVGLVGCSSGPRSSTLATSAVLLATGFWIGSAYSAADGAKRYNNTVRSLRASRVTIAPTVIRVADRREAPGAAISFRF